MKISFIICFSFIGLTTCSASDNNQPAEEIITEEVVVDDSKKTLETKNDEIILVEKVEAQKEESISDNVTSKVDEVREKKEASSEPKVEKTDELELVEEDVPSITLPPVDFHAYEEWNSFLKKYVSASGKVNYAAIKSNKAQLNAICEDLKKNSPQSNWTKNQKLAYWINVYNAFTIKLVVDNYPTTSITKITAKPWDKKFISIGGSTYSLNDVENNIIRKRFNEPRIHFALNCASKSCPVLLNAAYTASNLNYRLTSQTKRFFKDSQKNNFSNPKAIKISKIFDWYKVDFTKNGKTVVDFINKYRAEQLDSTSISYMEYSWDLNK